MKKKIIIPIGIVALFLVIGFIIFDNNKIVSTITLDINPSIEINLTRNEKVKNVKGLNDDAKEIVTKEYNNKSLDEAFELLITKLIDKGYTKDKNIDVIVYAEGDIPSEDVASKVEFNFGKEDIHTEVIVIYTISAEDEELAKKYDVSPAKISYIKSIIKDNENINIEDLSNKSVSELNETKATGKYCDKGYTLEGDWCLKEKERVFATSGEVCPRGYAEHEGKCYEETMAIESKNYICNEGLKLVDNKCVINEVTDAFGKCNSGDYDNGYCVRKELIGNAEEYCRLTPATDILMNHKCYGPKPTINGGCLNGDKLMNGGCVDMNSYYESDYRCKSGDLESDHKCYKTIKSSPDSYYCEENAKLEGTKCIINRIEDPRKEMTCPSGYTPIADGSRCLNVNKSANKESGLVCENENSRLEGNMCVIYEVIEAKFN